MNDEQPNPNPGPAPAGTVDLGEILGGPFRDPAALTKFAWGCLAVLLIPLFGLGLLALLGYAFQTAVRAQRGEPNPLPDWEDPGQLLGDGLRVVGVILGYALPLLVLTVLAGVLGLVPLLGTLFTALLTPLTLVLGLLAAALAPVGLAQFAATGEFRAAFRIQDSLRLVQAHPGTCAVFLLALILIDVLSSASGLLCGVGILPGAFWGLAASGIAVGRLARVIGI